ncbi:hypothetical protein ACFW16_24310 [Inquilinus sp. NPDC058860]|uniref:hypothetical protein n=1 Tax=Inquilinus sp. NPDC058860 TaxID=3346652 RepID=UPI00369D4CFB
MTSFDELQARFAAAELAALAHPAPRGRVLQPALPLPTGDDQALWSLFDAIPLGSPIYAASGTRFFTAYAALIGALVAGTNPLDPIAAAKRRLTAWGARPPDWSIGCAGLLKLLGSAPSLAFPFTSTAVPEPGFWGLWAKSPTAGGPSAQFASGDVSADLSFAHALSFAPRPGDWYVSSALALAYATRSGPPWPGGSDVTWDSTFGPDGTMPRVLAGLSVVAAIDARSASTAVFGPADQALIRSNAALGLWPYYLDGPGTSVGFDGAGRIAIRTTSGPKQPVAVAATVLTAGEYLG